MMAFHGTFIFDSENWCTYWTWFVLSSGVFCHVSDQTLAEQLYTTKVTIVSRAASHTSDKCLRYFK